MSNTRGKLIFETPIFPGVDNGGFKFGQGDRQTTTRGAYTPIESGSHY